MNAYTSRRRATYSDHSDRVGQGPLCALQYRDDDLSLKTAQASRTQAPRISTQTVVQAVPASYCATDCDAMMHRFLLTTFAQSGSAPPCPADLLNIVRSRCAHAVRTPCLR
jgi:hypothetical protein